MLMDAKFWHAVILGPYPALGISLLFCTILLRDNKALIRDLRETFAQTTKMFTDELKDCRESKDRMFEHIRAIEQRVDKPKRRS
jgi:hypothetical protein